MATGTYTEALHIVYMNNYHICAYASELNTTAFLKWLWDVI